MRYSMCVEHLWVVVDVSIDSLHGNPSPFMIGCAEDAHLDVLLKKSQVVIPRYEMQVCIWSISAISYMYYFKKAEPHYLVVFFASGIFSFLN